MDAALECYYAMRQLVIRHPGGRASESALASLRMLCQTASRPPADGECRARLRAVEEHAAVLFSGVGSGNWVRRRILAELEEFRMRLYFLEVRKEAA